MAPQSRDKLLDDGILRQDREPLDRFVLLPTVKSVSEVKNKVLYRGPSAIHGPGDDAIWTRFVVGPGG
jgi:hypothetical protein